MKRNFFIRYGMPALLVAGIMGALCGCDHYNEVTPANHYDLSGSYNLPKGTLPSSDDLKILEQIKAEYDNNTKIPTIQSKL